MKCKLKWNRKSSCFLNKEMCIHFRYPIIHNQIMNELLLQSKWKSFLQKKKLSSRIVKVWKYLFIPAAISNFICFSKTYLPTFNPDRNTWENPVQIAIKIESTLKYSLIFLKKAAKRHNGKLQPYTVFCKCKYYSKYKQKGTSP